MTERTDEEARAALLVQAAVTSLQAVQPAAGDWVSSVRQTVRRRRTGRVVAASAAAVVGVVVVSAGARPFLHEPREALLAGPAVVSPSPSPAPSSLTPSPAPSTPSPTPAAATPAPSQQSEPSAEPGQSPLSAVATPAGPAGPASGPPTGEASWPAHGTQDIEIDVALSDPTPQVGEELVLQVTVTGQADRKPFLQGPRVDDSGPGWVVGSCVSEPGSPPPARSQTLTRTFRHTFDSPGRHEVAFRADASCSYYYGEAERTVVVDVGPAA